MRSDHRYMLVSIRFRPSDDKSDDIRFYPCETYAAVGAYKAGFEDAIQDDDWSLYELDRRTGEFCRSRGTESIVSSPWGRLYYDKRDAVLMALGSDRHDVEAVLTDRMMEQMTDDEDYKKLREKSRVDAKDPFCGSIALSTAAWFFAAEAMYRTPESFEAFLKDRSFRWGRDPWDAVLLEPRAVQEVVRLPQCRAYILSQPELVLRFTLVMSRPDPEFIHVISRDSQLSAEALQARPDIRDRRLELAAAGLQSHEASREVR